MSDVFIQRTAGQTQSRLLSQVALDATADISDTLYEVATGVETIVKTIYVCNRGSTATFRLHHDEGGTTYDTANALYYDYTVTANNTFIVQNEFYLLEGDSIGISSDPADNLTFSIYGEEVQARAR